MKCLSVVLSVRATWRDLQFENEMVVKGAEAALLSLALLGNPEVTLISDRVPHLNVGAVCKSSAVDDKTMGLAEPQSFADCMRDETTESESDSQLYCFAFPSSVGCSHFPSSFCSKT